MGVVGRLIWAIISAAATYAIYVYLPPMILTWLDSDVISIGPNSNIFLGNVTQLVAFIIGLGYIIVGASFAAAMAAKKTWLKGFWTILQTLLSICFWGIFLLAEFNTITVVASLGNAITLNLDLDITILFYVMMGGNIFGLIIAVLDLIIGFMPDDEDKKKGE